MGRRNKVELQYFPVDIDIFRDTKIKRLVRKHHRGFEFYMLILSNIYGDKGYYMQIDSDTCFDLSEDMHLEDEAQVKEMLDSCLSDTIRLFDRDLYEKYNILTSAGIQRRYAEVMKQLKRNCTIYPEYLLLPSKEIEEFSKKGGIKIEEKLPETSDNFGKLRKNSEEININSEEMRQSSEEIDINSEEKPETSENFRKIPENFGKLPPKVKESKVKENKINNKEKTISNEIVQKKEQAALNIAARKKKFYDSLIPFVPQYGKDMIRNFFDYWSELNQSGVKMKFELEKTWEIPKRLSFWARKEKSFPKKEKIPESELEKNQRIIAQIIGNGNNHDKPPEIIEYADPAGI